MKTVFSNSQDVMHKFAEQSQTEARSSNVYMSKTWLFKHDFANQIFSYGRHYLLAEFIDLETVYINDGGYSNTTAKHISHIEDATRQYKQIFFSESLRPAIQNTIDAFNSLKKAKKPEKYISIIQANSEKFNSKTFFFVEDAGSSPKFIQFKYLPNSIQEKVKECRKICKQVENIDLKALQEQARKKEQVAKKKAEKAFFDSLKKWFNFEIDSYYLARNVTGKDYLRINRETEQVETTQNVKIDFEDAANLYKLIQSGKDIKGYKIGYYTVISLNGVLQIGCHKIDVDNMHKVGKELLTLTK